MEIVRVNRSNRSTSSSSSSRLILELEDIHPHRQW